MATVFWIIGFFILLIHLLASLWILRVFRQRGQYGMAERSLFFKNATDLVIILDESLILREINRAARIKLRMTEEEGLGQKIEETGFWPTSPADRRKAMKSLRRALNGEKTVFSVTMNDAASNPMEFEIKAFPIFSSKTGRRELICYGKDITVEFGTRQRLKRRTEVEDIIARMMEATFSEGDSRKQIPGILEIAGGFLGARRAFLLQTDRTGKVVWDHIWSTPGVPIIVENWSGRNVSEIMPFKIGKGVTILSKLHENQEIPEEFRKQAEKAGLGSITFLTLSLRNGSIFGYAGFTFSETRPPEDGSVLILLKLFSATMSGLLSRMDDQRDIKLFRESVDAAGQGIALVSGEGTVIYSNGTYGKLTGHTPDTDRPIWEHYVGSYSYKVKNLILPMVASGERWTGELRIQTSEGTAIDTIESFVPVDTDPGDQSYIINMITDISDRKRLEAQLIKARKEAEIANRAKSDYLANMSHEIRTPMNAVIGLAYLALQTELDARQRDYLSKINTAAKGLLNIINDILDLSKIEAGRLELEAAPFSVDEVMEGAVDIAADSAREKGLKLLYLRSQDMPEYWVGDRHRLGQVLLNLVGNAVKFTSDGRIVVSANNDVPGHLRFVVEDTGIGMTEEQVSRLFTPFQQAEASTSRQFGGTGLGLTICKQIVELMNGAISVSSVPGEGSRFDFTVAMQRDDTHRKKSADRKEDRPTAYVMACDALSAEFHSNALTSVGYRVTVFEKIKNILENPEFPRVLVYDIDGCSKNPAAAAWALSDGAGDDFTLILSGSRREEELEIFAPSGVRLLTLPVPYSKTRLKDGLAEIGNGSGSEKTHKNHGAVVGARILLADDNAINRQVGGEFLSSAGLEVDLAENGRQALELSRSKDYNIVFMDLHMPEMDGYEATSRIRADDSEIPVIAMTASPLNDVKTEILNAGFSGYLPKPIDPDQIFGVLSDKLGIPKSLFRTASRDRRRPQEERAFPPTIDTGHALKQVLGDRDKLASLLQVFGNDYSGDAELIATGPGRGDNALLTARLHSLRGAAGQVGALSIMKAAGELEDGLRSGDAPEQEKFDALAGELAGLISDIIISPEDTGLTIGRLDHLEELIRNSDDSASTWLEKEVAAHAGPSDGDYVERIRTALKRWNFDEALDVVDDWRVNGLEGRS